MNERSSRFSPCLLAVLTLLSAACGGEKSSAPAASATPGAGEAPAASASASTSTSTSASASASASASTKPPFGFLAKPLEGETVKAGDFSFGWALADSGIAQVTVVGDNGATSLVALNGTFPGVAASYPKYPGVDKPGFSFTIPKLGSGLHSFTVTLTAKDGGKTEIRRMVRLP